LAAEIMSVPRSYSPSDDEPIRRVEKIDHGDSDVREAVRQVAENERREKLAQDLGAYGVSAVDAWHTRAEQIGPRAAVEFGQLYATSPRPPTPVDEERQEDDISAAARKAYREEARKAEHRGDLDSARMGIGRLEQRLGLDGIDQYRQWYDQFVKSDNPVLTGAQVGTHMAQLIDGVNQQAAANKTVASYGRRISDEEHPLMQDILARGYADNMETAQAMARYELAMDVDEFGRDATRAKRQMERREMAQAHRELAVFRHHMKPTQRQEDRMKALLESGKAPDLETAWRKVKGYDDKPRRR
jgi:hypothetical protein